MGTALHDSTGFHHVNRVSRLNRRLSVGHCQRRALRVVDHPLPTYQNAFVEPEPLAPRTYTPLFRRAG